MVRKRTYLLGLALAGLMAGGFFVGRVSAQQPLPAENTAFYRFPAAWGEVKDALPGPTGGLIYIFEAPGTGVLRVVRTGPGGPEAIEVIRR